MQTFLTPICWVVDVIRQKQLLLTLLLLSYINISQETVGDWSEYFGCFPRGHCQTVVSYDLRIRTADQHSFLRGVCDNTTTEKPDLLSILLMFLKGKRRKQKLRTSGLTHVHREGQQLVPLLISSNPILGIILLILIF